MTSRPGAVAEDAGLANLAKVDHIVVLMLGARGPQPATDLQIRIAAAARELRRRGHPENRP